MTQTQNKIVTLEVIECPTCHLIYGVTQQWVTDRRRDHLAFWCPNGHNGISFSGESDLEKAERFRKNAVARSESAETALRAAHDQAQAAERSAAAYKGHLTRAKNRIANGVCPVQGCRRHFDDVQAHMTTQHPGWKLPE